MTRWVLTIMDIRWLTARFASSSAPTPTPQTPGSSRFWPTKHLGLAALVVVLSAMSGSMQAQLAGTDVYEPGAEGEIWRYMGSAGASFQAACRRAGYDPNSNCDAHLAPKTDELWEPIGFDVFDNGNLADYRVYVADRFNWRLVAYDYAGRHVRTLSSFVGRNGALDSLGGPEGVTIDAAGNILVTDTYNGRVVVFDRNYTYLFEVRLATGALPAQIALAPGTIVTAPATACATPGPVKAALTTWSRKSILQEPNQSLTDKNQVLLFDEQLCRVGQLGQANAMGPQTPGNFFLPGAPAIGPRGEIYVAAYQESKIEVFWPDASAPSGYVRRLGINTGEPNTTVRDARNMVASLSGPYGAMVDKRGRLVVGDTGNNRIAVFLQPWHPENTSPRDPGNPSVGTQWQFAFELVAGGHIAGSWLAVVREDRWGRWLGSSVVHDVVYAFQVPDLAVTGAASSELVNTLNGSVLRVRSNISVPLGKSVLTAVIPTVAHDQLAPVLNRASLGAAVGPFLAAPGANVFEPTYVGTPVLEISEIRPGHFAQVYWDFPVQSSGAAQFWTGAHKVTGLAQNIVAEPKLTATESVPASCLAPTLNPPAFDKPRFSAIDSGTNLPVDVYGNGVTLTLSASQAAEGVREIQVQHLEGLLNGVTEARPGARADLLLQLSYSGTTFWTIRYRAVAQCGAASAWATTRFKIDAKPPRLVFGPVVPGPSGIDPDNRPWFSATEVTMQATVTDDDTFGTDVHFPDYPTARNGRVTLSFTDEAVEQRRLVRVQDPVGNRFEEWSNILMFVNIDRGAPTLTLEPLAQPNAAGWYRTDVPFHAVAAEPAPLSGVKTLTSPEGLTILSPTTRHRVEGSVARGGEGAGLTVTALAEDYAGNRRTVVSAPVKIDRTAPVVGVTPAPGKLAGTEVTVQLQPADLPSTPGAAVSGVARVMYRVNGGEEQPYTGGFTLTRRGTQTVTFWAEDVAGNRGAERTVAYELGAIINRAPICTAAAAAPAFLWPPNHKQQHRIAIQGVTDPDGDAVTLVVTRILQDEPTETIGDGNTPIDAGGLGTATPWLRAERMGPESDRLYSNGRLYEIFFTATDPQGASCEGRVQVGVPHDQGQGAHVIDNGCRWDSTRGGAVLSCAPGARLPAAKGKGDDAAERKKKGK